MKTEAFLMQHEKLNNRIRSDTDQLELLRSSLGSIPSSPVHASHVRVPSRENAVFAERLAEIDELEAMIRKKEELAARLKSQIKVALNRMRLSRIKNAQGLADLLLYYFTCIRSGRMSGALCTSVRQRYIAGG